MNMRYHNSLQTSHNTEADVCTQVIQYLAALTGDLTGGKTDPVQLQTFDWICFESS